MTTTSNNYESHVRVPDVERTELFRILANPSRLFALRYLSRRVGAATLEELSDYVASASGFETRVDAERVAVSMHHSHLPRLEDAGLVRYEADRDAVELLVSGESLRPLLSLAG